MAEPNEVNEEPAGPSVATAEQQPTSQVTTFEELLQRVSSLLDEDNLRRLCNHYDYCTENRQFNTALELFQFLEEGNLWGCGTEQEKAEVLIERMRKLGRHDIVEIVQTFNDQVDVHDAVPSSLIRVKVEDIFGQCRLEVNRSGKYVVLIRGNVYTFTTAMYQKFGARGLLAIGGSVTVVGYALYKMGYNAVSFSLGCVEFDISTEPDKERTVRRRLENGTFLKELQEEVKDIIKEHSDILGDLKDFTIISCKEICQNKEKEEPVKDVSARKIESLVKEMGELKELMISLNEKVGGTVETNLNFEKEELARLPAQHIIVTGGSTSGDSYLQRLRSAPYTGDRGLAKVMARPMEKMHRVKMIKQFQPQEHNTPMMFAEPMSPKLTSSDMFDLQQLKYTPYTTDRGQAKLMAQPRRKRQVQVIKRLQPQEHQASVMLAEPMSSEITSSSDIFGLDGQRVYVEDSY
ncbi:uncharacterized protein LOC100183155 isoform X1 [Ciona intestinalis]